MPADPVPDRHVSHQAFEAWVATMPEPQFHDLLIFANRVQSWSIRGAGRRKTHYGTFAQAAKALGVSVERIADAVGAHYWMFTPDYDLPLAERHIDHDGE